MRRGTRSFALLVILGSAAGGCAAPVVFENPVTHRRVDCTAEARRDATAAARRTPGNRPDNLLAWELEHRCAAELRRAGFVCVSGC